MTHRLIFVCEANICRSPLMEQVLRARDDAAAWDISSAGTRVGPGGIEMCEVSATIAASAIGAEPATLVSGHLSTAIDADELRSAHLILTASRAERSAIAAAAPELRSRTFTLREAVFLGTDPVQAHEFEIMAEFDSSAVTAQGLALYAEALHARRGFIAQPAAGRTLLGRPRRNPFDISDAHHGSDRAHRAMLTATVADVEKLHRQVTGFLDAPTTR